MQSNIVVAVFAGIGFHGLYRFVPSSSLVDDIVECVRNWCELLFSNLS